MFRQHGRSADTSIVHIILYMPLIFFVYQTLSWKLYTIINVCANNFGRWLWCRYLLKIILQFNLSGAETPNCQRTGIVGRYILEYQLAKKVHLIEGKINTCCYCAPATLTKFLVSFSLTHLWFLLICRKRSPHHPAQPCEKHAHIAAAHDLFFM